VFCSVKGEAIEEAQGRKDAIKLHTLGALVGGPVGWAVILG
jgi:hypothetical protein